MSTKWARTADTAGPRPNLLPRFDVPDRTCSIAGCGVPLYARSWCKHHYDRDRRHGDPLWTQPPRPTLADRFWSMVQKADGCWEWQGGRNRHGYGTIAYQRRPWMAHRVSWLLAGRMLDEALELDHLCRNPGCVNPDHLEQVTHRENMLRSPYIAAKATATQCKRGHPFDARNTGMKSGNRYCRRCHADYQNARYHAAKVPGAEEPLPERRRVA